MVLKGRLQVRRTIPELGPELGPGLGPELELELGLELGLGLGLDLGQLEAAPIVECATRPCRRRMKCLAWGLVWETTRSRRRTASARCGTTQTVIPGHARRRKTRSRRSTRRMR